MDRPSQMQDTYLEQSGYSYFAFISYRRTDSKWAAWLKKSLQSYRLPQKTHAKHPELPMRFHSVFLDKTHLTPGLLDEGLKAEVQASKFLIVICSRSAREKPEYLDAEIGYFLDGGGDATRIIPFIVDDAPKPEEECFPPRLQELCKSGTILGANIHDSGRRNAFLKVIAYMHGLRLEEIESDDTRRRRNRIAVSVLAGAAVLAGAIFGVYRYMDYNSLKTFYYLDYAERNGIPEGIGPLGKDEIRHTAYHYTIVSSRNKVREVRYEDAHGQLSDHHNVTDIDRPAKAVYEYGEDDAINKVTLYDTAGELVMVKNYSNLQTVDLQYEESDSYVGSAVTMPRNPLVGSQSYSESLLSNVSRYLLDYDDNGYVTELRYVSNPAYNDVAADKDGIGGVRYERDEFGRIIKTWYLTYTGDRGSARYPEDYQIIGIPDGVSGICVSYNEDNEPEEYYYMDASGDPIMSSRGYSKVRITYDEYHNPIETRYYNTSDDPICQKEGYAVYKLQYDQDGNQTGFYFLGTDEEPVLNSDGYASAAAFYDENGNIIKAEVFGLQGEPVLAASGFAILEVEYDEAGRRLREGFSGTDGKPILNADGFAYQSWEYDENDRVTGTVYYGTDGSRCMCSGGFAEKQFVLDEQGRCIEQYNLDAAGAPVMIPNGYCSVSQKYDEMGNLEEIRFFDVKGDPVCAKEGFAKLKRVFDERGNVVLEQAYGVNEEPVLCVSGYAAVEHEYDDAGNETKAQYLGIDGLPIMIVDNYSMYRQSFNRQGRCLEKSYYDTDGLPVLNSVGFSIMRSTYDERGNLIMNAYYGPDGKPVTALVGFASVQYTVDKNGRVIKEEYFDTDGRPVNNIAGYASEVNEYDDSGLVKTDYYDADGELIITLYGP